MIFYIYNALLIILYPLFWFYFSVISANKTKYAGTLDERYGHYAHGLEKAATSRRVWIHAVSVGEIVAATPLIRALLENMPGIELVVSTTTTTGRDIFIKTFGDRINIFYFPFDFPWVVKRALSIIKPDVLVLMETELWPNVVHQCRGRGTHVLLLNGRVSDRMFRAGGVVSRLYKLTFAAIEVIGMQTSADAERIIALGAPREKVRVIGNFKFDGMPVQADIEKTAALDKTINPRKRKLFVAGSTHPGEEEIILDVFIRARAEFPDLLLVLAPRHIERTDQVAALAVSRKLSVIKRSELVMPGFSGKDANVIVLDTIGELRHMYALATACFVGGSLIERGGHNVLEPAACGKAPFYGPHTANFRDSVQALEQGGGGRPVADGDDLADKLIESLRDDNARKQTDERAFQVMKTNAGAVDRGFDLLKKFI